MTSDVAENNFVFMTSNVAWNRNCSDGVWCRSIEIDKKSANFALFFIFFIGNDV